MIILKANIHKTVCIDIKMPIPDLDVFESSHHSHYRKTYKEPTAEYHRMDYTRQFEGPKPVSGDEDMNKHGGLNNTRFGKGFQRRRQVDITNPISIEHEKCIAQSQSRKLLMSTSRSHKLLHENFRSGFNLLTGEAVGNGPKDVKSGKKFIDISAYDESRRCSGLTVLKNSGGRYHAIEPLPQRHANDKPSTFNLY